MKDAYNNLRDKKINDKYKHGVVSFLGAKNGYGGAGLAGTLGLGKEVYDVVKKSAQQALGTRNYGGYSNIIKDSLEDLIADNIGIKQGLKNPKENPYELLKLFFSLYLK